MYDPLFRAMTVMRHVFRRPERESLNDAPIRIYGAVP